jgi:hypothetical protein
MRWEDGKMGLMVVRESASERVKLCAMRAAMPALLQRERECGKKGGEGSSLWLHACRPCSKREGRAASTTRPWHPCPPEIVS